MFVSDRTVTIGKLTVVVTNVDEDITDDELREMVIKKLIHMEIIKNEKKILAERFSVAS